VLTDVSFEVRRGEFLAIVGPSGSGKTTVLNLIGGLDQPTSGTYLLDGIDTTSMSDNLQADVRRNKIGFVFQSFHLISRLTAAENIGLPLTLAGVPPKQRDSRVRDVLESVGLTERAEHRPDQLSGGQRQRVAIARATIMRPTILLADEPTGNLDQSSGESVIQVLEALNDKGIILLVVTHDPDIGGRARRRIRMVDGRISVDDH
jgi:putative ABC transport system ATP-binding protein